MLSPNIIIPILLGIPFVASFIGLDLEKVGWSIYIAGALGFIFGMIYGGACASITKDDK